MLRNELPALLQDRSLSVATVLTLNIIILFAAPSLLFPWYTTHPLLQIYTTLFSTKFLLVIINKVSFSPWYCTTQFLIPPSLPRFNVVHADQTTKKSSNTQSAEVQFEICKHYFAGPGNLWSDLSSTANALISLRLDRTAYEAIVRQQPRCNMQLNGVDEMQAIKGREQCWWWWWWYHCWFCVWGLTGAAWIGSGVEKNDNLR